MGCYHEVFETSGSFFPITLEPLKIEQNNGHNWNQWPQFTLEKCQNRKNSVSQKVREKVVFFSRSLFSNSGFFFANLRGFNMFLIPNMALILFNLKWFLSYGENME